LVYQIRQRHNNIMCNGVARFWHHALEQFCTNDRSLWLDLCGISLERASIDVELSAPVLHYHTRADLYVLFKMKRILIMGLPGAGKTTLAAKLTNELGHNCLWLNADEIRQKYNDWDFSTEGRIRQSQRMRELADASDKQYVLVDFVAPLNKMRDIFAADFTIWMDTIQQSRFADTDTMFVPPTSFEYDLRIENFNYNITSILEALL